MNIFRVFTTILYPFFIYLLLFSRKNLVKSGGTGNDNAPVAQEVKPDEYPKEIKLFKADPNDATKNVELDTSEYKVTKTSFHTYVFNDGIKCTLVQRDGKDVWKYNITATGTDGTSQGARTSSPVGNCITGTGDKFFKTMDVWNEALVLEFDDHYEFYDKRGDNWCRYCKLDNPKSSGGSGSTGTGGGGGTGTGAGGGNQGSGTGTGGGTTTTTPTSGGGGTTTN